MLQDTDTMGYPPFVHSVITMHNWKQFCVHPDDVCVPIVREFYANFTDEYQEVVFVRGKQVRIDSQAINRHFGITSAANEHTDFVASVDEASLNSVITDLCVTGAQWTTSTQGALTFLRSDLKPEAKVWYHFLKTRLMPTTHIQSVTKERALLLHSILQGRQINIGQIIHQEICACAQKPGGSLWFPNLISDLCEMRGVPMQDTEERLANKGPITMAAIARISQERGNRPHRAEPEEDGEPHPTTSAHPSSHTEDILSHLEQ